MQYAENAAKIAFKVHSGNGPYLLLVHGFLSSKAQWQANIEALGRVCRPITAELWGHGQSPAPEESGHYAPSSYALEFEKIRKKLGAENWFVCGYSIGASLSIRYAIDFSKIKKELGWTPKTHFNNGIIETINWYISKK